LKLKKINKNLKKSPITKQPKKIVDTVQGTLDVNAQGMGFVVVAGMPVDIKIKRENLKNALHGDIVEVSVFKVSKENKRPEGIVTSVIQRAQSQLIGTVETSMNFAFVVPDNKNIKKDIFLNEKNSKGLKTGDRVIVKITDWTEKMKNPSGEIVEILTDVSIHELAMKEILLQNGFTLNFPEEVLQELANINVEISSEEIAKRKDLRKVLTFTIDPLDAKDFDDAISIQKLPNGNKEIGVHIADVSHYVLPKTALDKEAYSRATSVYLPDRVLPMLPEKISNELCSLRPHEDKLTFSAMFEIDDKNTIVNHWIGRTVIHSDRRFTYEEVQEIIEGKDGDYKTEIMYFNSLSQHYRKIRMQTGAINFNSSEVRFKLDETGKPIDVIIKTSKESHQLVEEMMLLANKTVATFIQSQKINEAPIPFPYRIHDEPDKQKLLQFTKFAGKYGHLFNLKDGETIATSFNEMIANTLNIPEQHILHSLGIRTMAKAIYSSNNIGHYGLAFENYCHFTSPIRRYPDVLVHRILNHILEKHNYKIWKHEMSEEMNDHCSAKERKAMEAEREANKYKQVEYMQDFVGEEFEASISGVSAHGFWAETIHHKCEGFISCNNLMHIDDFRYVEEDYALIGMKTKKVFQVGQKIMVQVASTNLAKRQIDYDLVEKNNK
jgi:ribonuclease R